MIRATLLGLLTLGLAAPACHRDSGAPLTPAAGTRAVVEPENRTLTDAQIVGVLTTIHSNELQQARIALKRARSKEVRDLARTLIAHHEKSTNDARALETRLGLVADPSPATADLRSSNTELVVALSASRRKDFDLQFITAQIGNYEEILALFDARLLLEVRSGELRAQLETLRPLLQSHLTRALEVQEKLSR
jgi:predicted outer membrane protein